jgi:NAD(P)-dependent dehydrogenase (short-subunit alcohol dehydrogenase family)
MTHPFQLDGLRIAITGAGGGIGSVTATFAAQLGADVFVSDIEAPDDVAESVRSLGRTCEATALDVTDRAAVEAWCKASGKIDAVVDCAAICPFDDWHDEGWDEVTAKVFNVNLQGPLNITRIFMESMAATGGGRVVLIGSIAGRLGGLLSSPHYVMTKGGIHSFVRWAARQGAPSNVLVNAIAPGVVETPMTQGAPFDMNSVPLKRKATAEEIAGPLVFLISPAASYLTGAVLDVNGGVHFS